MSIETLEKAVVSEAAAGEAREGGWTTDPFPRRHLGPDDAEVVAMLDVVGVASLDELIDATLPPEIRLDGPLRIWDHPDTDAHPPGQRELLDRLATWASFNTTPASMIGQGYHGTITPPPIRRHILESPLWYTPYTPYQAEISQGRLEALLNFQTMVCDLTGLEIANASMLDEATAAAEAMAMCYAIGNNKRAVFYASRGCHPQTLAVLATRAESMGITLRLFDAGTRGTSSPGVATSHDARGACSPGLDAEACGVLVQTPETDGVIVNHDALVEKVHATGALVVAAADPLALVLMTPPGEWGGGGADIVVGSTQRFGVPMGMGGPHAAYLATRDRFARKMPGRLVGVSRDAHGHTALRLAVQTREQHIKRDRATSNICTAQVLPAVLASMYAVYHGPSGLRKIAEAVHDKAKYLHRQLADAGAHIEHEHYFDTLRVRVDDPHALAEAAAERWVNIRIFDAQSVCINVDEATTADDLARLIDAFEKTGAPATRSVAAVVEADGERFTRRSSEILTHPVFNTHRSETQLLRYITSLQRKDISLADGMIPLGSCTMKLNATAEMIPVTWPGFADVHPFAPVTQTLGYQKLYASLEAWLKTITGFAAVSLQPNAGSQGEYAGLLAIRGALRARSDAAGRDVCLIPESAHGTNPASAVIAGFRVVPVACRDNGDVDLDDLRTKAAEQGDRLACLMITYPSTHGIFEPGVREACDIVHDRGGLVYMDGANMNAQVGLTTPARCGADVCHLNLHKTFCIPHGGGGPGMGPIACTAELAPHLPGDPRMIAAQLADEAEPAEQTPKASGSAVSAAAYGSGLILTIPWMYIGLMGGPGLTRATQLAILHANYMAARLREHYDILYINEGRRAAHEFILDCRPFQKSAGVSVEDVAKRLIDYGFHAPTMSWPVAGTLMIEPTESEDQAELDRFCDAMMTIRREISAIESGEMSREDNPLKHAPHTAAAVTADSWEHSYPRSQAAYPAAWLRNHKYWPPVGRVDNAWGDRNLACTCPPMSDYADT